MSGFQEFIDAIKRDDYGEVKRCFKKKYINERWDGHTPLHWATIYDNNGDIVRYLLLEGFNIEDETTISKWRSIHTAAGWGNTATMTALIVGRCSLDCVNSDGDTPIDIAKRYNKHECVRILWLAMTTDLYLLKTNSLSKIMNPKTGSTLLDKLLNNNDPRIMEGIKSKQIKKEDMAYLISRVNKESSLLLQECLLYKCFQQEYYRGLQILCTPEIVNKDSLFMGVTALECAVQSGITALVRLILWRLTEVNESWTQAEKIANEINLRDIEELISHRRTYLSDMTKRGYSRLHIAVYDDDHDMVEYLLEKRLVNPYEGDKTVGTALSLAYNLYYTRCVNSLIKYNVNVNTLDKLRQCPLHVAINNRMEDNCNYIVDNTTNIEGKDSMGFTVLQRSILNDCRYICDRLVKKGARCDKYVNIFSRLSDPIDDLTMILSKTPKMKVTNQETVYSLCLKSNETVYPCLLETIDRRVVDLIDGDMNTLLHLSAVSLKADICSHLISKHADINYRNGRGNTPLLELLQHNKNRNMNEIEDDIIDTVNVLIDGGASRKCINTDGCSVWKEATEYGSEKLLLTLIHTRESVDTVTFTDWSAWTENKYFPLINELILIMNKVTLGQYITIDLIKRNIKEVDISLIVALYDKAADFVQEAVLETILQQAAIIGDLSLFGKMINNKMSPSSSLEDGESLLSNLIKENKAEFVDIVIRSRNARLLMNKKNSQNKLPLHVCIEYELLDVIPNLIMDTICVNDEDNDGNTPLSRLIEKMSATTEKEIVRLMGFVKMLIKVSANIYKENKLNKTAIMYCTKTDLKLEIESYFREHQLSLPSLSVTKEYDATISTTPNTMTEVGASSVPLCHICEDEPKNCTLNCGHMFCMTCACKEIRCFICRRFITDRIQVFD